MPETCSFPIFHPRPNRPIGDNFRKKNLRKIQNSSYFGGRFIRWEPVMAFWQAEGSVIFQVEKRSCFSAFRCCLRIFRDLETKFKVVSFQIMYLVMIVSQMECLKLTDTSNFSTTSNWHDASKRPYLIGRGQVTHQQHPTVNRFYQFLLIKDRSHQPYLMWCFQ